MKIEGTTISKEPVVTNRIATESSIIIDSSDSILYQPEYQENNHHEYYRQNNREQLNLFLCAFRILYTKYLYSSEPLCCKVILVSTDNNNKSSTPQQSATRINFPDFDITNSTVADVFNDTKEISGKYFTTNDPFSINDSYELKLLAINAGSDKVELDLTIKINQQINFIFKTPPETQLSNAITNSEHHFQNILHTIHQSPEQKVSSIPILNKVEYDKLLQISQGQYDPSICQPTCLHQIFEGTAKTFPHHTAVFCNGKRFSYKEIDNKANQLARCLQQKGMGKGDFCGILLPRTEEMYIAMLAILKVGAAYIPMDVSIPRDRLNFILNDSKSKGLISHSKFHEKYNENTCFKIIVNDEAIAIDQFETKQLVPSAQDPTPDDLAYIIYTSGTTGTPKGVKISHSAICNLVKAEADLFRVTPDDNVFQGFSISFDASLEEIWLAFNAGAQLFVGTEETIQSGSQMATFINHNQITIFSTVPTLLSTINDNLPTVKTLILGGEACSMELVKKWATDNRRMINTYGPTEATVIATYSDCKPDKKVTIGRPVINYCTYILDANQHIAPFGVAGELCIGGLGLANGYINNPVLSASKFITPDFKLNPAFPNTLYRSGDLVRYNETGEIEFLGRIDSQVKLRGFRIELAEIESQLLLNNAIKNCALTVKKDHCGIEHLIAYVVVHDQTAFDPIATKKVLRTKLAPYMIPSRFLVIDAIPLLASGKIDRKSLPDPEFQKEHTQKKGTDDSTISNVTHLWESIFGLGKISPKDNFFELGGHSLLASQMISELRKDIRYEKLAVKDVYSHPTIEKLSIFIESSVNSNNQHDLYSPPVIQKSSRLTYFIISVLQFATTIFFYGITALILLIPLFLKNIFSDITTSELIMSVVGSFVFFYFFWMSLSIVMKWLVIGKFKEGSYPLWGFYYFRFWLVKKFVDMVPINLMAGTPFINFYFRLLGAKIGKNTYMGTDRLRIFDLISIGDDCSLLKESTLLGYTIENEMLHLGKITMGNRCFLGARSMIANNSIMEDDSMLLELSMLTDHETIPNGAVWKGSPARPFQSQHNYSTGAIKRIKGIKKTGFQLLQVLALVFVIFFPQLLASPFAYIYYKIYSEYNIAILLIASIPLMALFIFVFCLFISAFKWLLLGKQKPMDIRLDSLLYIRKWIVDALINMSLLYFRSIYATLYLPKWLRTTGVKVGKRAEISTLNHLSTDLLEIGNESFLADSTSIGVPMVYLGNIYLRNTHIGNRSFIGNSAVLLPGSKIGDDCLIGVLSTAPDTNDEKINGSSWLGSPPIYLPKRQESPKFSDKRTFHPPWYLYIVRGTIEFFKITMPYAIASWLIIFFYQIMFPINQTMHFGTTILIAVLLFTVLCYSTVLFGLLSKWLLIGQYKANAKPLWSTFVWRNEFINSITECLIFPLYQNMMLGTAMAPFFFRMMGCKIGKRVYMETNEITEFDLVHIQSGTALNFGSTIQTHLFEDRVMKMSKIDIGKSCTVGAMSVVLYDSKMGNHAVLGGLSLLMKGESLPESTKWQGSPSGKIH